MFQISNFIENGDVRVLDSKGHLQLLNTSEI